MPITPDFPAFTTSPPEVSKLASSAPSTSFSTPSAVPTPSSDSVIPVISSRCPFMPQQQESDQQQQEQDERELKQLQQQQHHAGQLEDKQQQQQQSKLLSEEPLCLWEMRRPVLDHCPKLTRRQLRLLNKTWRLSEVGQHKYRDDAWIAVDGKVYDITEHIVDHPGWETGGGVSTILSILAHSGRECSQEFRDIHRPYPIAYKQLRAYFIGDLDVTVNE